MNRQFDLGCKVAESSNEQGAWPCAGGFCSFSKRCTDPSFHLDSLPELLAGLQPDPSGLPQAPSRKWNWRWNGQAGTSIFYLKLALERVGRRRITRSWHGLSLQGGLPVETPRGRQRTVGLWAARGGLPTATGAAGTSKGLSEPKRDAPLWLERIPGFQRWISFVCFASPHSPLLVLPRQSHLGMTFSPVHNSTIPVLCSWGKSRQIPLECGDTATQRSK